MRSDYIIFLYLLFMFVYPELSHGAISPSNIKSMCCLLVIIHTTLQPMEEFTEK